ncbi:MAG: DUF882 domain-containing protein [Deltaproteobacteria bacterium]|nr:DUF882 domain-containing protein [Deltaproteobacteria bacterium]
MSKKIEKNNSVLISRRQAIGTIAGFSANLIAMRTFALSDSRANGYIATPVSFENINTHKKAELSLITRFGTINVHSRHTLSHILQSDTTVERPILLHPKLLLMLQRIGDRFLGHTLEILSAHRYEGQGELSNHSVGRAVDMRVAGISLEDLFEFARTLPSCGIGYYPESNFIHLDVRDQFDMWIDYHHKGPNCAIVQPTEETNSNAPRRELEFYSVPGDTTLNIEIVSTHGIVNNVNRIALSRLAAYRVKDTRIALFHPRLMLMLQDVADHFPGRRFEVISGYRIGKTSHSSPHNYGRAMDFRISGIENKVLYDFARTLPLCGTGYYPNSVFVHLDVRDKKTTWVDYSGVGE